MTHRPGRILDAAAFVRPSLFQEIDCQSAEVAMSSFSSSGSCFQEHRVSCHNNRCIRPPGVSHPEPNSELRARFCNQTKKGPRSFPNDELGLKINENIQFLTASTVSMSQKWLRRFSIQFSYISPYSTGGLVNNLLGIQ